MDPDNKPGGVRMQQALKSVGALYETGSIKSDEW